MNGNMGLFRLKRPRTSDEKLFLRNATYTKEMALHITHTRARTSHTYINLTVDTSENSFYAFFFLLLLLLLLLQHNFRAFRIL